MRSGNRSAEPFNSPFRALADRLDMVALRRTVSGVRPSTSMSSPSTNRRPPAVAAPGQDRRPPRVEPPSFDHLATAQAGEQLDQWQAERRHQVAARSWETAIQISGVRGNPRPDGRSNPTVAAPWDRAVRAAGVTGNPVRATADAGQARTAAAASWDAAFARVGIDLRAPRTGPGGAFAGRRVLSVSRRGS